MSIVIEASELLELFLWEREHDEGSKEGEKRTAMEEELADVLIQCLNFANAVGVDPSQAVLRKLQLNEQRYPVDRARGSAAKYTEL